MSRRHPPPRPRDRVTTSAAETSRAEDAESLVALARIALTQESPAEALELARRVLSGKDSRKRATAHVVAGRALGDLGRHAEGLAMLVEAIRLAPDDAEAYFAAGLIHEDQGQPLAAFQAYQKAIEREPRDVRAYNNLAAVLVTLRQLDLAIATARIAVALAPDNPDVYLNLGAALRLKGKDDEAHGIYRRIVALDPDHGEALVELCHRMQHACEWEGLDALMTRSWALGHGRGKLVSPFAIMTATTAPSEQLTCARVWGARLARGVATPLAPYAPRPAARRGRKLRIGYLSADFHAHATAMLVVDLIERHDRSRFAVYGYSLGPDDGSPMRRRIAKAFDRFVDLKDASDSDAARRIHADEIDVLLDLKGYTQDARVKIMAHEPAPIQINYLGFPGTMGAPFIDYVIADRHVAPMRHQTNFDEKIVHLPDCYQPNDRSRRIGEASVTRAAVGLPGDGFVFCSFNSLYKITPEMFDVWTRLLATTPGSVLWLLRSNERAAENLRREAARRGVDPTRLVFAPFVAADAHLARLRLADLFLDTFPVNAHTTASEALWVGLPLVTLTGETFASRVAGSLLHAIGAPDLVAETKADYEALAQALARDPERLAVIRARLQDNRLTAPLFDTPRYARHFEAALAHVVARMDAGDPPAPFAVAAIEG
jgi:predicted O-linked N-acetylglucosamine transferase (SPINDLY family)